MTDLLTLAGVHTHVGRYHILQGIDFGVPMGQTTMLLGRNGAGKTSTLRTIMGLWQASAGTSRTKRPRISPGSASAMCRRAWRYFPIFRSRKTWCWRRATDRSTMRSWSGFSDSSPR